MRWKTSGIILAGGSSTRLGKNKALLDVHGEPLIQRVVRALTGLVERIVVVTNRPETLAFLDLPMVDDIYPGVGTLGGLHAGLNAIETRYGVVVGCDMPFLNAALLRYMIALCQSGGQPGAPDYDAFVPRVGQYLEPLQAIYARRCRHTFEKQIISQQYRISHAFKDMHIRYVEKPEIVDHDPEMLSFFNVNKPGDLERMWSTLGRPGTA